MIEIKIFVFLPQKLKKCKRTTTHSFDNELLNSHRQPIINKVI